MADHQVESAPFGHVSTAKQATFQVAPRCVGRYRVLSDFHYEGLFSTFGFIILAQRRIIDIARTQLIFEKCLYPTNIGIARIKSEKTFQRPTEITYT